jgi:hypothetical protein
LICNAIAAQNALVFSKVPGYWLAVMYIFHYAMHRGRSIMSKNVIIQFYAELLGFEQKIWRRFQVKSDITVARLGYIVQVLFEMTASHLMAIEVPEGENFCTFLRNEYPSVDQNPQKYGRSADLIMRYEISNDAPKTFLNLLSPGQANVHIADATQVLLHEALMEIDYKLNFYYDFGDGWQVPLTREKIIAAKDLPGVALPRVLEGAGFGIVEDVGGIGGLAELAKAFKKKKGEDYKHFREWLGINEFDITAFDLDDMNFRLKKIPRIYKEIYEDELEPTQRSINLIERKYLHKKQ